MKQLILSLLMLCIVACGKKAEVEQRVKIVYTEPYVAYTEDTVMSRIFGEKIKKPYIVEGVTEYRYVTTVVRKINGETIWQTIDSVPSVEIKKTRKAQADSVVKAIEAWEN